MTSGKLHDGDMELSGDVEKKFRKKKFNFEEWVNDNKIPTALALVGLIFVGFGVFMYKQGSLGKPEEIQVLESVSETQGEIVVEVAGGVEKPGVYKLENGSRVEDLLIISGGVSADADRVWIEKMINRASKLIDGQKLYIPSVNEQSDVMSANGSGGEQTTSPLWGSGSELLVNINSATLKELDALPGIGPVYGQNIIEHRPYSSVVELLSRGVLNNSTYEKIKEKVTVY